MVGNNRQHSFKRIGEVTRIGEVSSKLVTSKSRVALIKEESLPRLELLAGVVNARLLKFVVITLQIKIHRVVWWTDSMMTLHWIRRQSSCWKPFVVNRVLEIQSTWDPGCWHYCASKGNPADLLTRGLTCDNPISNGLWWNGCQYLLNINPPNNERRYFTGRL